MATGCLLLLSILSHGLGPAWAASPPFLHDVFVSLRAGPTVVFRMQGYTWSGFVGDTVPGTDWVIVRYYFPTRASFPVFGGSRMSWRPQEDDADHPASGTAVRSPLDAQARAVELRNSLDGRRLIVRTGQSIPDVDSTVRSPASTEVLQVLGYTQGLPADGSTDTAIFIELLRRLKIPTSVPVEEQDRPRDLRRARSGSAEWYCELGLEYVHGLRLEDALQMAEASLRLAPGWGPAVLLKYVAEEGPYCFHVRVIVPKVSRRSGSEPGPVQASPVAPR